MINDIINGVAHALYNTFGATCKIYKEAVKQGFTEPCFSIVTLEPTSALAIAGQHLRGFPLDIMYFPKDTNNAKDEMYRTAEMLFSCLEYINVLDNFRKGATMRYEIVDGVLHFFVTYSLYIKPHTDDVPTMDNLEYTPTIGGNNHGN